MRSAIVNRESYIVNW